MVVKRGGREDAQSTAPQDLRDTVKATWLEVQFRVGPPQDLPVSVGITATPLAHGLPSRPYFEKRTSEGRASGHWPAQGTNGPPTPRSHVRHHRSAGWPMGRESYGDGVPIVVRGRESRPHGEGEQVSPTYQVQRGTRDAKRRNCPGSQAQNAGSLPHVPPRSSCGTPTGPRAWHIMRYWKAG
jgi:hypothetical protein